MLTIGSRNAVRAPLARRHRLALVAVTLAASFVASGAAGAGSSCEGGPIELRRYALHTWSSDNALGTLCRRWEGDVDVLAIDVASTRGGFDAGIVVPGTYGTAVDEFALTTPRVRFSTSGGGTGTWWAGPKVAVYEPGTSGLDGNYENYVIESASLTPDEVHKWLMRGDQASALGTTVESGGTYRHYRRRHGDITQFFAVRSAWRGSGSVELAPILAMWRRHGLPPKWHVNHARVFNVETSGEIDRTFVADYRPAPPSDDITDLEAPAAVRRGATVSVRLDYEASAARQVRLLLQDRRDGYRAAASATFLVEAGRGTIEAPVAVRADAAVHGDYQWQTYIAPPAGGWEDRLDDSPIAPVRVTAD